MDMAEVRVQLPDSNPVKKKRGAPPVLIIFLILICFVYSTSDWIIFRNPNEFSRLYLTRSLIDRQTLVIDELVARRDVQDKSFYQGHYYTDKAPGISFVAAPVYLVIRLWETYTGTRLAENTVLYIIRIICISIPSILFLLLLYSFWGRISDNYSARRALLIAYALGTPAWAYSMLFFGHQLAGICLFTSFTILYNSSNSPIKRRLYFQGGFFSGLAFIVEYPTILVSFLLFIYMFSREYGVIKTSRRFDRATVAIIIPFLAGLALPLAAVCYYHWKCFGSIFSFPYYHVADPVCAVEHSRGLSGVVVPLSAQDCLNQLSALIQLIFSPFRGIFFYSPFLILGTIGIVKMIKHPAWKREGWLFSAIFLVYVLFYSAFINWEGGWSMGPRHLVPLIPFLVTAIVFLISTADLSGRRKIAGVLTILAIISILFTFVGSNIFPHFPIIFKNPLYEFSWWFLERGILGPTVMGWFEFRGLPSMVPLTIIVVILLVIMITDLSRLYTPRPIGKLKFSIWCLAISGILLLMMLKFSQWKEEKIPSELVVRQNTARSMICFFLGDKPKDLILQK